jgi:hypothetical protein
MSTPGRCAGVLDRESRFNHSLEESVMILGLCTAIVAVGFGASDAELSDQTFEHWRDLIRPKAEECAFLSIPWRESFHVAVNDAQDLDKPILLWTMNGHPLGCT